jgi:hypothetical protein
MGMGRGFRKVLGRENKHLMTIARMFGDSATIAGRRRQGASKRA